MHKDIFNESLSGNIENRKINLDKHIGINQRIQAVERIDYFTNKRDRKSIRTAESMVVVARKAGITDVL
ncbi:hypothetical protein [Xenorhabdus bovienii]|uniref:hypothetical protein n=1 Tax=Xenorhabdus bovienii TaxID=40576 RepID=UPI000A41EED3|nr:hypothetical protein [Xenorhabdus bovienii]